uniref:Uncharacterized protein n=1 Tax=Anopheles farauti TaxID=69004 RepID=A0A182Q3K5_9DIPT
MDASATTTTTRTLIYRPRPPRSRRPRSLMNLTTLARRPRKRTRTIANTSSKSSSTPRRNVPCSIVCSTLSRAIRSASRTVLCRPALLSARLLRRFRSTSMFTAVMPLIPQLSCSSSRSARESTRT